MHLLLANWTSNWALILEGTRFVAVARSALRSGIARLSTANRIPDRASNASATQSSVSVSWGRLPTCRKCNDVERQVGNLTHERGKLRHCQSFACAVYGTAIANSLPFKEGPARGSADCSFALLDFRNGGIMSGPLGPIAIDCDAPGYLIVKACQRLGIQSPEDVRWCRMSHFLNARPGLKGLFHRQTWKMLWEGKMAPTEKACFCAEALPRLTMYTFTMSTGKELSYCLGQCRKCHTVFWEEVPTRQQT